MEETKYILGLDLGMMQDYSALSMIEQWEDIGPATDLANPEHYVVTYYLTHLQRYELGTQYPAIVQNVKERLNDPRISFNNNLVMDATGLGGPVLQMFRGAGMNPIGVTLTSGNEVIETNVDGYETYNVPKRQLVSALMVLVQSGRLKIAEGLELATVFEEELQNFHYFLDKKTGHDSYESAKDSVHDDLVVGVALACWYGSRYERHMKT
jgi:hypothetical protein